MATKTKRLSAAGNKKYALALRRNKFQNTTIATTTLKRPQNRIPFAATLPVVQPVKPTTFKPNRAASLPLAGSVLKKKIKLVDTASQICKDRIVRREIMHAKGIAGKLGKRPRLRRTNFWSYIKC